MPEPTNKWRILDPGLRADGSSPAPVWLIPREFDALFQVIKLAAIAHRGQLDKAGEPYLWHVLRVGISLLPDVDAAQVGILHDLFEDCGPEYCGIGESMLGKDIMEAIKLLTHDDPHTTYTGYILQIAQSRNTLAIKVKLADLADNLNPERLARLPEELRARLEPRYRDALLLLAAEA